MELIFINILMIFGMKKVDNFDPCSVLLAIATNIPALLKDCFCAPGSRMSIQNESLMVSIL